MGLLGFLLVGLVAGYLAGLFVKGSGFGALGNIVVGVLGAMIGWTILGLLGFHGSGPIAEVITATFGAIVLLFLIGAIRKG